MHVSGQKVAEEGVYRQQVDRAFAVGDKVEKQNHQNGREGEETYGRQVGYSFAKLFPPTPYRSFEPFV